MPLPAALARLGVPAAPGPGWSASGAAALVLDFLRSDGCPPDEESEPRMIEAAERTGELAPTLQQLAADLETLLAARDEAIRRSAYPLFLLHATVPAATVRTLLTEPGRFLATVLGATALLWTLLAIGAAAWRAVTRSPAGALALDRLPVLGTPRRLSLRARWLRLVASLHGVGINPIEALATAQRALGPAPPSDEYAAAADRLRRGGSFEDALSELRGLAPEERGELIAAAAVGDLERALRRVAERATAQWQDATRRLANAGAAAAYAIAVVAVATTLLSFYSGYYAQFERPRR